MSTVIVIQRALYGRMRLGRCVLRDYGYVGCFADVVAHMDVICSGRRACSIRIPDAMLDRANPCPKDFKTYLLIDYDCVASALSLSYSHVNYYRNRGVRKNMIVTKQGLPNVY